MNIPFVALLIAISLGGGATISGCTQMPTEKQGISDMRPQISFKTTDDQVHSARVIVDGLDMGSVGNYVEGSAALRVLPGTHVLTVALAGRVILEEKFYVGDGVSRTFVTK